MTVTIDLREYDQREHNAKRSTAAIEYTAKHLSLAQRIREKLRAQGFRIPLTEAEKFAEAEKRLRGQP